MSVILVRLIVIEQNSALSFLIIFSLLAGGLAVSTAPHCKAWCFGPCVVFQGVSEPELSLSGQLSDPPLPPPSLLTSDINCTEDKKVGQL